MGHHAEDQAGPSHVLPTSHSDVGSGLGLSGSGGQKVRGIHM